VLADEEADLLEIWPEPLPEVVRALTRCKTVEELNRNLPDVEVGRGAPGSSSSSAFVVH
jgi:hypothetical protein